MEYEMMTRKASVNPRCAVLNLIISSNNQRTGEPRGDMTLPLKFSLLLVNWPLPGVNRGFDDRAVGGLYSVVTWKENNAEHARTHHNG
jgi:hypothetical protein